MDEGKGREEKEGGEVDEGKGKEGKEGGEVGEGKGSRWMKQMDERQACENRQR